MEQSPTACVLRMGNDLYGTAFAGGPGGAGSLFRIPIPSSLNISDPDSDMITLGFFRRPELNKCNSVRQLPGQHQHALAEHLNQCDR